MTTKMITHRKLRVTLLMTGALVARSFLAAADYNLVDLGVPTGHRSAVAVGINNSGNIAINADQGSSASDAYFYSAGVYTPIPTALSTTHFADASINDRNEVVGTYTNSSTYHGFYYNGTSHSFHNADYNYYPSNNNGLVINNSSSILGAGADFGKTGGGGAGGAGGWIYSGGVAHDVDTTVSALSHVFDLNNNGLILATNGTMAQYYVWDSTQPGVAFPDFLSHTTFADGLTVF